MKRGQTREIRMIHRLAHIVVWGVVIWRGLVLPFRGPVPI